MSASALLTVKTEAELGRILADSQIGNLGCVSACVDVLNEHGVRAVGRSEDVITAMRRIIVEAHNLRTIRRLNRVSGAAFGFVIGAAALLSRVEAAVAGDGSAYLEDFGWGLMTGVAVLLCGAGIVILARTLARRGERG